MSNLDDVLASLGLDASRLQPVFPKWKDSPRRFALPGEQALDGWRRLSRVASGTQHWPVLLGGDEELRYIEEAGALGDTSPGEILQKARTIGAKTWFAERAGGDPEYYEVMHGAWPEQNTPNNRFSIPFTMGLEPEPLPRVHLALVPTDVPWEAPAYLRFGGWNECPFPEEHVAVFSYWYGLYGAVVVGITHDVVEMEVARPPATREAALELAVEQFHYCADIVAQGTQGVEALAASLVEASVWYFWWD